MIEIKIKSEATDMVKSGIGYKLEVSDNIKGKGFYNSRIYASIAEATIAKGILILLMEKYGENKEFYSEFDFLSKATLRLCYGT